MFKTNKEAYQYDVLSHKNMKGKKLFLLEINI
jgi:hypothetical protein